MSLFLYHGKTSTCSSKVRLVLAETGLDWNGKLLDLNRGESHSPEYLKLSPNGVVPTLLVAGTPVIESSVIIQLLDEISGTPRLTPENPVERAHMRVWLKRIDEELHPSISTLTYATAIRRAWQNKSQHDLDAMFASIDDLAKRERRRSLLMEGTASTACQAAVSVIARLLADLKTSLSETDYVVGAEITLADLTLLPYLHRLELMSHEFAPPDQGDFNAWYGRMKERASFRSAVLDWMDKSDHKKYAGFEHELAQRFAQVR